MLRRHSMWLLLSLLSLVGTGCCCVPGPAPVRSCQSACEPCGVGLLGSVVSCRGGCGDVYVDEWLSEPPVVDNCGYDCGGCGNCGQCTPIRNFLRVLWGCPYEGNCCPDLCGPSCDGCSSCDGGYIDDGYPTEVYHGSGHMPQHSGSSCNCGQSHVPSSGRLVPQPQAETITPMEVAPEAGPTPTPAVTPSSAKRLNPAAQRRR
jgi:hypothetical protein